VRLLYRLALYAAVPLISCLYLWRGLTQRGYWRGFTGRFGAGAARPPGGVWLHAVSVGEVQACAPLIRALRAAHPQLCVTVTTFTPTGAERARALFGAVADVRYLPFDLPSAVRRFLDRVQPRLAVVLETELWPNLYSECARRGVPLVLANARLSQRSLARYLRLGSLFRDTLAHAAQVVAQAQEDAQRFRTLGSDPARTHVAGNIKFDFELPADIAARGALLRAQYAQQRPVWIAGSTHGGGEEAAVLAAHRQVRAKDPRALLVLAPRHPPRFAQVADALAAERMTYVRRTQAQSSEECAVLLLDTLGELLDFYAAADVAFVGGSLVPIGGHNLLEPAALGVPILTGPYNANGAEIAALLQASGAARQVTDAAALATAVGALFADPQLRARMGVAGSAVVAANRGAVQKLLALLEPFLAGPADG
jgi:3-deoxy-D-manno-octulosonic-acid transferase